ncbi:hypothetical protein [Macrococcus sp. DPC7161]|uniref:hypothetical protein n=1 Tax=Macrococcus sp. DPC7161 TaxID=2507060 RepID=UPI00100B9607|nr:hypothetical protein [Macrococcus sp. DPC7161]RXK17499.1 hypothetical protein ER639_10185 [Macrococcus sp. DPC7161]
MTKDLNVTAKSTIEGGTYNNINVMGMCDVEGELEAVEVNVLGKMTVEGDMKVSELNTKGKLDVEGNLNCQAFNTTGKTNVEGNLQVENCKVTGMTTVDGSITGKTIAITGILSVDENVEVETFVSSGKVNIDGLLNADTINILLGNKSTIEEIGGQTINVTVHENQTTSFFKKLFINTSDKSNHISISEDAKLISEVIEGDDISLERVICEVVRGKHVVIKNDCIIDRVEYTETIEIEGNAKVKEQIKIG